MSDAPKRNWLLIALLMIGCAVCFGWFAVFGIFGLLTFTGLADEPLSRWAWWESTAVLAVAGIGLAGYVALLRIMGRLWPKKQQRGFDIEPAIERGTSSLGTTIAEARGAIDEGDRPAEPGNANS